MPKTPGFKMPGSDVFNCYDPPSRLLGPPKVTETGLILVNDTNVITATTNSRTSLKRPLTVGTGDDIWYLRGCYGSNPENVLGTLGDGERITDLSPATLDECASRCRSSSADYSYFGMASGG